MRDWLTPAEIADLGLPGLPATKRGVNTLAADQGWSTAANAAGEPLARRRKGRGGGWEYHYTLLPSPAQASLVADADRPEPEPRKRKAVQPVESREDAWSRFDDLPDKAKDTAKDRLAALDAVELLEAGAVTRTAAVCMVATKWGVAPRSLFSWMELVRGVPRPDWLPYLAPRYAGRTVTAECPAEAWDLVKADYLRLSAPAFSACYWRVKRIADDRGWILPSQKTLQRRMDAEIPPEVQCLAREGVEALRRRFPAQRRDRSVFAAMEAINADGHKFDVFVRWLDGTVSRVVLLAVQDLRSGMIVGWRVDRSESAELVRLAFGDVIGTFGIPQHAYLDNGRGFASKWLTGQMPFRHRFKIKNEEPAGILTSLGVTVHWTTPYSGQSKPIERAFRDLCETIAKHPAFEGAYTGNNPTAKPENYGSRAIPLDKFLAVVEQEIRWHNERPERRSQVCGGRMSFREAFDASYATAMPTLATDEQKRMWLLAAELVTAGSVDGAINLMGNRYWSNATGRMAGERLTVRFDPQNLHAGVHVYTRDNRYVGFAPCIDDAGFADTGKARQQARDRTQFVKGTRMALDAERRLSAADVARALPQIAATEPPEARLVRGVFNDPMAQAAPERAPDDLFDDEEVRGRLFDLLAEAERRRA